jgi:hypothetical protein
LTKYAARSVLLIAAGILPVKIPLKGGACAIAVATQCRVVKGLVLLSRMCWLLAC